MNKASLRSGLVLSLRLILGLVFLIASFMKLKAPYDLVKMIEAYQFFPETILLELAMTLILFEGAIGTFLITGWQWRLGALGASFILIIFLGALTWATLGGIPIECSCFGSFTFLGVTPRAMFLRNGFLLLTALICYNEGRK